MRFRTAFTASLLAFAMQTPTVLAISFSDVPSTHVYASSIAALAERGIVKGNPDGNFYPEKTVNRAEFITMLYRSLGSAPAAPSAACFTDVPSNAWFAGVVCDASAKGSVGGYSDRTFRPEKAVNRVEAIKMIFTVLSLSLKASAASNDRALAYSDVSATAWYMLYVPAAFERGILPLKGDSDSKKLLPEQALTRAEAAALIAAAIGATPSSSASSEASSTMSASSTVSSTRSSADQSSSQKSAPTASMQRVDFPFSDDGTFNGKESLSYQFKLNKTITASIAVTGTSASGDGVTCRLFKIDAGTSLSLEYYLGIRFKESCNIRATLTAGEYQLDIQPASSSARYTVYTKTTTGDGNDGFSQAKTLSKNVPKVGLLETDDTADWYSFSLTQTTNLTVEVTNSENLMCIIYPLGNVDLYGFSGPQCNAAYDFPAGSYVIGVQQRAEHHDRTDYSVRYK